MIQREMNSLTQKPQRPQK